MSDVQQGPTTPTRRFDPQRADCFAPYINRSDDQVTELIAHLHGMVHIQGEYDQGDGVILEFDQAADLVTIAEMLWKARFVGGSRGLS